MDFEAHSKRACHTFRCRRGGSERPKLCRRSRIVNSKDAPLPRFTVRLAVISVDIVAGKTAWPAGSLGEDERQRLHASHESRRREIASWPCGFERPAVAFETEDLGLLAPRQQQMDLDQITGDGLESWCPRLTGRYPGARRAWFERCRTIVHADRASDFFGIRHHRGSDDVVMVLEEQNKVAVWSSRRRDNVGAPSRLHGHILAGDGIPIFGPTRPDDDRRVQSQAGILHD